MSFNDWADETASVMDDDMEDKDIEDEDVELNLRIAFVAIDVFELCCIVAFDGGRGAGRTLIFPLLLIIWGTLTPFFLTAP